MWIKSYCTDKGTRIISIVAKVTGWQLSVPQTPSKKGFECQPVVISCPLLIPNSTLSLGQNPRRWVLFCLVFPKYWIRAQKPWGCDYGCLRSIPIRPTCEHQWRVRGSSGKVPGLHRHLCATVIIPDLFFFFSLQAEITQNSGDFNSSSWQLSKSHHVFLSLWAQEQDDWGEGVTYHFGNQHLQFTCRITSGHPLTRKPSVFLVAKGS